MRGDLVVTEGAKAIGEETEECEYEVKTEVI